MIKMKINFKKVTTIILIFLKCVYVMFFVIAEILSNLF